VFGGLLTVVGITGFLADAHFDSTHHSSFLGLWDVNGWYNLFHLVVGLIGLAVAVSPNRLHVRWYAGIFGAIWFALAIWGFYETVGTEVVSGLPNTTGANIFHLILGLLGIAACAHGIFIPQGARHDDHTGPTSKGF
jgi:Domain of unknown function (DUF4383)